jgi:uncharacterized integral membrane protein
VADQEPVGAPAGTEGRERAGRGPRFWLVAVLIVLAAIFILQNSQEVEVDFFFATTHTRLIFALLLSIAFGVVIGWLLGRFRPRD